MIRGLIRKDSFIMHNFRELETWKRSNQFAIMIYKLTESFPPKERYNLISQMNRASVSISSNIAEGCSRSSVKDLTRFLDISLGSSFELESQLQIAKGLNYISNGKLKTIITELHQIQKMIQGFRQYINK